MVQQIAVICAHDDAHIPFVEKHLPAPLLKIDPWNIVSGATLSFYFDAKSSRVTYKGEDITGLGSVWLRKPRPIRTAGLPVAEAYKTYSGTAIENLAAQLLTAFPKARWLSDVYAQHRANNKTLQLSLAQACGFNIAPTLFTSDPEAANDFIAANESCVSKPLATQFPVINGRQTALMTMRVGSSFTPKLDGLHVAPAIFQKELAVDVEVRAIVVGEQVFAATVETETDTQPEGIAKHIRDNRRRNSSDTLRVEAFELPSGIAKRCIRHCRSLGLAFGAIDLIRDTQGKWWFLENNPNGQWAFVEDATNLPIGKAIADYLRGVSS
ncbi:MAG TPA: hypothetical protein VLA92_00075 [Candidatus Saccharimonadales bacterium]|nr:hypothetical protein [Candidatus Saccharimonadales bacterium]